jgi:hypothetical protein
MKKTLMFVVMISLTAILSWSCHLGDFNLDKLAPANDIKPVVYLPLAYGTYTVGNQLTTALANTDTIKVNEIDLNPMIYDKTGVSFSMNAIDSVYLVVNFTNGTPMKMRVQFDFIDKSTSAVYGKIFDSGLMPSGKMDATGKVIESVSTKVVFPMDSNDMNNMTLADGIQYTVKLFQPDSGSVIVKHLSESQFQIQISVKAPVSLSKLN